eukprot:4366655-Pyramimonas_sp.AAC.1
MDSARRRFVILAATTVTPWANLLAVLFVTECRPCHYATTPSKGVASCGSQENDSRRLVTIQGRSHVKIRGASARAPMPIPFRTPTLPESVILAL